MKANKGNYKLLENYLKANEIEYVKVNEHHYRILGEQALVDVWPARMTCHVVQTEAVDPNRYFRLAYNFNEKQLEAVLNGEDWKNING